MTDRSETDALKGAVRDALLSHAADDYYGLWEAVPAVRSVIDGSDTELMAMTGPVLKELWDKRLIEFVWGDPSPRSDHKLSGEEVVQVLADSHEWNGERAYSGRVVWFTTRDD